MKSPLVSARAKALTPYTPGEQPQDKQYIKLNTNENPYPPAPGVRTLLQDYRAEELRLYPDPQSLRLRQAIAQRYQLSPEEVFTGNGSDEVLAFIFYAFFDADNGPVLFPAHTYSFYPVYCTYYGLEYQKIPMNRDFSVSLEGFREHRQYAGVIFPNPNAPTGIALTRGQIADFLQSSREDRVYVIDEAYVDFGGESCSSLVREFPNLVVVHTFSKSRSLAGLRLGFALGNPELIKTIFTVKDSFNSYPLNRLSQELAIRALKDEAYFQQIRDQIVTFSENEMVVNAMREYRQAFGQFRTENNLEATQIEQMRTKLATYYTKEFSDQYKSINEGAHPNALKYFNMLDDDSIALQYHYIRANQHPLGCKDELDTPGDASQYSRIHHRVHPVIRSYLRKFGYYDIFLVDLESGDIVYSVFKELDYSTSLTDGPFAKTNFGECFRRARDAT
ncbi:MAG: pyridoxal phosphate-dependent aminotransferase, partial [Spirochaetota bacterium]